MSIHKYNGRAFRERFDLTQKEVDIIIEEEYCPPIGYKEADLKERMRKTKERSWLWSREAVDKYEKLIHHAKDKHLHFYRLSMAQIAEMKHDLEQRSDRQDQQFQQLRLDIASLKSDIEKKEIMVDLKYIGIEIGYSTQTLLNSMEKVDDKGLVGRLQLPLYKDLIFHKIKNRWQTPIQTFLELRQRINSELMLEERKRKGIAKENLIVNDERLGS